MAQTEHRLSLTASEFEEKINKIDNLAEKNEIPTKVSELTNDSEFITESDMQGYAQPKGNYALKTEIPDIPVKSVNGKTGVVNLTAGDVGALPSTTVIPSKLSDLTADSTHRTVTDTEKSTWNAKLNASDLNSIKGEITEELKTYVDETILNGEW